MRGKVEVKKNVNHVRGITPAYAGKSEAPASRYTHRQDHPRLCGEKGSQRESTRSSAGSPPPMRGKDPYQKKQKGSLRITPAYAGKSFKPCIPSCTK